MEHEEEAKDDSKMVDGHQEEERTLYQFQETLDFLLLPFKALGSGAEWDEEVLLETLEMILEIRVFRLTEPLRVLLQRVADRLEGQSKEEGPMFH